jgi:hypothetical protein
MSQGLAVLECFALSSLGKFIHRSPHDHQICGLFVFSAYVLLSAEKYPLDV